MKFDELLNYEVYENNSLQTSAMGVGGFIGIMGAETTGQVKDLRLIKKIFGDLSFSFNVGTNLKTQKLEKLDDLIKLKGV